MFAGTLVAAWICLAGAGAGAAPDVGGLVTQIERGSRPQIDRAVNRLQFLGDPPAAVLSLTHLAYSPNPQTRENAAYALSILHPASAGPALADLLEDPNPVTRLACCQGLRWVPPMKSASKSLGHQLGDKAAALRRECARTLGAWRDAAQLSALLAAVKAEGDPEAKEAEVQALGQLGKASAASALEPLLRDPSEEMRYAAAKSLAQIGSPGGRTFLQAGLANPDPFTRSDTVEIVGQLDQRWAADALGGMLADPAPQVCVHAARILAARKDPRGLESLVLRAEGASAADRPTFEAALSDLGVTQSQRLAILQAKALRPPPRP